MAKTRKNPVFYDDGFGEYGPQRSLAAGTWGACGFTSTNNGGNWSSFATGLIPGVDTVIFPLAVDPLTPTTLQEGTNGGGVFGYRVNPFLNPW
jgi:hypothetical protein